MATQTATKDAGDTEIAEEEAQPDPEEIAKEAGLRYVHDAMPGIRRRRAGRGFTYIAPNGETVRDARTLERIRKLVIPPAWTDVWICQSPSGHIQATGRDAKGRKQYRYHERWRKVRDANKYEHLISFARALPRIREQVNHDLSRHGLPRERVLATVVHLLETTYIRIGNQEYARQNGSFGLTTMRDRHVKINGSEVRFQFRGKSGKDHTVELHDRRVARIVKQCRDIPGYELFQYFDDDGKRETIESSDVNEYLHQIVGNSFTAKDFRTWAGTVLTLHGLIEAGPFETKNDGERNVVETIKRTAEQLGNTPAVCRRCYVHPAIIDAYLNDAIPEAPEPAGDAHALSADELLVFQILEAFEAG